MATTVTVLFATPAALAQQHHHHATHCPGPEPLLTVADFNGDGTVDAADQALIVAAAGSGEYVAFFDRNADGAFDAADVELAAGDLGRTSAALDREVAAAFWGTEHLRDQGRAIAEGWMPTTQEFQGHGVHWGELGGGRTDLLFEAGRPEGLNYSADGELLAVYYAYGPHWSGAAPPPEGFTGDEDVWHHHVGACLGGVDPVLPVHDHRAVVYRECLSEAECYEATGSAATIWVPKIHMVHLWLYKLNPCGKFGGTHPDVGRTGADATSVPCAVEDILR